MPFCKYCGNEVDDNHTYCKKCGKNINISKDIDTIKNDNSKTNKKIKNQYIFSDKKGKDPIILLIGIIVVILIISLTIWAVFGFSALLLTNEADELYNSGNYNEALQKYTEALEINPEYASAIDGKFYTLLSLGDETNNINYYNQARALKPESLEPILREGKMWEDLGHYIYAINFYSDALTEVTNDDTIRERLYALCDANRPSTGTISQTWPKSGFFATSSLFGSSTENNKMTFDNSLGKMDCLVIMKSSNNQASGYVRAGDKYTLSYVPNDKFYVYVTNGEHYNPSLHEFMENVKYYKVVDYFNFYKSGYNVLWELTLYSVKSGDVELDYISESSFPDIA